MASTGIFDAASSIAVDLVVVVRVGVVARIPRVSVVKTGSPSITADTFQSLAPRQSMRRLGDVRWGGRLTRQGNPRRQCSTVNVFS